jgi:hypothetical protein
MKRRQREREDQSGMNNKKNDRIDNPSWFREARYFHSIGNFGI